MQPLASGMRSCPQIVLRFLPTHVTIRKKLSKYPSADILMPESFNKEPFGSVLEKSCLKSELAHLLHQADHGAPRMATLLPEMQKAFQPQKCEARQC